MAEYRRLKAELEKQWAKESTKLTNYKQEQETDQSALDYEERRLAEFKEKCNQVGTPLIMLLFSLDQHLEA